MSTLVTSNISDGTTSIGTGYVVNGSSKVWAFFDGAATATIIDSFNTTSLVDNGSGSYDIVLANSFGSSNVATAAGQYSNGQAVTPSYAPNSGRLRYEFQIAGVLYDASNLQITAHGDLA